MQAIEVVVGAQYGSEAKGHVTAQCVAEAVRGAYREDVQVINIRVAGPNAGHTVYDAQGREFKFRQLPVGAVVSDSVIAYIAPGSEIDLPVLLDEIDRAHHFDHFATIMVSGEATLIEDIHKETEQHLVKKIGSTGKGIGAARADRLLRTALRLKDDPEAVRELAKRGVTIAEPHELYADDIKAATGHQHIIIEGTQGFGLGLHEGHYPKVTSSGCTAADFLAMARLSPHRAFVDVYKVWVVARAFPIRVAGDSGPLAGETTWAELGLPEEHTTVTQKVRRVGEWDADLVRRAVQANGGVGPVLIALTMADQRVPQIAGFDGSPEALASFPAEAVQEVNDWLMEVSVDTGARVGAVTTSPTTIAWVQMGVTAE